MATERVAYQDITIEDVDRSIYEWFNDVVDAHVEFPNSPSKKVNVVMAAGERWSTARDKRGLRDKKGLLILPIISIRRASIVRDRTMIALGTEQKTFTVAKRVDKKTNIVQNAISSRSLPNRAKEGKVVHEITTIPFPDWSVANYEIIVQSQYISQMNSILEKIFDRFKIQNQLLMPLSLSRFESDSNDVEFENKKPLEGYYFVGFVDTDLSDSGNFDEFTDTERIVKYNFNVSVPVYLQLDPEGTKPSIQVEKTAFDIKFSDERVCFVDDEFELAEIFSFKKPSSS